MLDHDLLRAFVAVAERGGFTRAAAMLGRTQSAVSMQMQRLEAQSGRRLLDRRGRRVELTAEGERLLGYARRILQLQDEVLLALATSGVSGVVRVGSIDDYATRVLPPILAAFAERYPAVQVELHTGLTAHLLERLGADYDLVLAMHPVGTNRGLVLRRDRPIWATSADADVHSANPLPLALYPNGCLFRRWATQALDACGRAWRCAYMSPSLGAVEAAVAAGLAVSVFKKTTLSPALRVLGPREGFPHLPEVEITLHAARDDRSRASSHLAEHIGEWLGPEAHRKKRKVSTR
jgi:DNA-binding transcriptional LysR family regulator